MVGSHTIKHWSSTQPSISLSSGEAEFYGVVRAAGQGLGYQSLLEELGMDLNLRVWTDSSAAIGICSRQGLGKLRHIDTHTLWLQQAVRNRRLTIHKVLGDENPADLLTKHSLSRDRMLKLLRLYDCHYTEGRAVSAPSVRETEGGKRRIAEVDGHAPHDIQEEDNREGGDEDTDSYKPCMPHLGQTSDEIHTRYPELVAPPELCLEDLTQLEDDALYSQGMKRVQEIIDAMAKHGRTRVMKEPNA